MVALNKFLNDALVAEYRELLLQARLLLLGYVQLNEGGMDVPHHFELVEREGNVDARTVHEFDQRVFIEPHDEVLQENLILVRRLSFAGPLSICYNIVKFIFLLARAFRVLAFRHMRVNQPDHGSPMRRVLFNSICEIAHAVNLNEGVDVDLKLVNVELNQLVYAVLPQVVYKVADQGDARENHDDVAIHSHELHQYGVQGDPEVEIDQATREDTHELVVEGDLLVVLEAEHQAGDQVDGDEDPTAGLRVTEDGEGDNDRPIDNEGDLETALLPRQAVLLDRLRFVVQGRNNESNRE